MYYDLEIISEVVLSCWSVCLYVSDVNEEVYLQVLYSLSQFNSKCCLLELVGNADKCQIQFWHLSFPSSWVDMTNLEIQHGLDTRAGGPAGD